MRCAFCHTQINPFPLPLTLDLSFSIVHSVDLSTEVSKVTPLKLEDNGSEEVCRAVASMCWSGLVQWSCVCNHQLLQLLH